MSSNRQNSKSLGYTASTKTLAVAQRLIQQGAVLVQSARIQTVVVVSIFQYYCNFSIITEFITFIIQW